jgi:hypothetical protein
MTLLTMVANEENRFGQIFPIRMRRKYRAIQKFFCQVSHDIIIITP